MENSGPRPRVVLPLSRIILLLIVGGIFIFRGIAELVDSSTARALPLVFILIGVLLVAFSAIGIVLRLRSRKD